MRCPYRWYILTLFFIWILAFSFLETWQKPKRRTVVFLGALIFFQSPDLTVSLKTQSDYLDMAKQINNSIVKSLGQNLRSGERVAFLPYHNDFFIPYLAATTKTKVFNVGGDKNLAIAKKYWPAGMELNWKDRFRVPAEKYYALLLSNEADAVVIPYFSGRWSAYGWPCHPVVEGLSCPADYKEHFKEIVFNISKNSMIEVKDLDYFAILRLKK